MESSFNEIVCPIDAEWKFKKSDLMDLKDWQHLNGKYFYAFNIPGVLYNVNISQNGPYNSIYFYLKHTKERKVTTDITGFIESANYSKKLNEIYEGQYFSFEHLFYGKTAEFFESKNKFFVNGEITVRVKGILKAERSQNTKISVPISMQWKIKEDDLRAKKESNDGYLRSKRINVSSFSDVKYYLSFYPKRVYKSEVGEKTYASVNLNVELGGEEKIEAVFDFSVDSANFNKANQWIFQNSFGYGPSFGSSDDLFDLSKGYIVDGFMTINLQGVLMVEKKQPTVLICRNGFATKAIQKKKDQDFSIVVGEKEIKVHKKVLMEASTVLTAMLGSGLKETTENKMVIDEKDFSFEVVDAAIKLCYSCGVPRKFTTDDLL
uniref:BTB domain-containing protein n=1 Tax=Panagrolaimus sp. ES5 TaxID=591445 RepID=A0AC34G618_9BILA